MERWLAALTLLMCSTLAGGHDDVVDRLRLRPDAARGVLEGWLTQSPHRVADRGGLTQEQLGQRVLDDVERSLLLELDGQACRFTLRVRELWQAGGATPGDLVTLRCPLDSAQALRVVSRSARLIEVSVELVHGEKPAAPVALANANDALSLRLREPSRWHYGALGAALLLGALLTAASHARARCAAGEREGKT